MWFKIRCRLQHWSLVLIVAAIPFVISTDSLPLRSPSSSLAIAQDKVTPKAEQRGKIDFRTPARVYEVRKIGRWTFQVEKQLLKEAPELAKKTLERLEKKLNEALAALPKTTHPTFLKLKFFLLYGPNAKGGGRNNGLEYLRKNAPDFHEEYDLRWRSAVVIYCAENYGKQISDFWALKAVVHEFAHAHHLEHWDENQPPEIRAAWENAEKSELYRNVKDESGKTIEKAYATANHLEYFAELSCMYFVGCNYPPLNRQDLEKYDPQGAAMVRQVWGLKK